MVRFTVEQIRKESRKGNLCPTDIVLFPENEEAFIEKSTAQEIVDYVSMHKKAIINSTNDWEKRSIKGVRTILGWIQNELKNAKPIKCSVHRHRDRVIQNTYKRICQKKKDKNNQFKNYVTGMMEWLQRNPNNNKPIEQVEKQ